MIKIQNFLFFFFFLALFSFHWSIANAAEIFFGVHNPSVGVGSIFEAGVFLQTEGESINAVQGKIQFPSDLVELREVRDGNSLISLWVKRPEANLVVQESGEIFFSGLVPGGFVGEDGYLFSLFFEAKQKGQARIETGAEQILLADGRGTKASIKQAPLIFDIGDAQKVNELPPFDDSDPPESFAPQISRDASMFDGKWFLVFAAQDKGSGIDYYEVQETLRPRSGQASEKEGWGRAESPYVLEDQGLGSNISVRAVDKVGNERIETLARQNQAKWYENYAVWIIMGVAFVLGFAWKILWRKKMTKSK